MIDRYRELIETAKKKSSETKKLFDRLRKNKPSDLDSVTNNLHEKAFEQIDCLQCGNCCRTTGPLLKNKDIENLANHFRMKESEFFQKYLRIDEDGDYIFKSMPCPFLGSDNYCSVYEDRPGACANYPHTQQRDILQKLKITYYNSMICPAVAEVVEGLKKNYLINQ